MKLSNLQKELIVLFKAYEMTENEVIWAMLCLPKVSQQKAMMLWIESNTAAMAEEVVKKAISLK